MLFAFGSADLTPAARATLQDVVAKVKAQAVGPVEIVGHTDTVGDPAANQTLSLQRAQAVLAALQPQAPELTLTASGRGESEPVAEDRGRGDSTEAALNRRVTVRYPVAPTPPPPPAQPGAGEVAPDAAAVSSVSGGGRLFEVLELRRLSDGIVQGTFRLTNQADDPRNYQQDFLERRSPNPYRRVVTVRAAAGRRGVGKRLRPAGRQLPEMPLQSASSSHHEAWRELAALRRVQGAAVHQHDGRHQGAQLQRAADRRPDPLEGGT